jgi:hypothetical protein
MLPDVDEQPIRRQPQLHGTIAKRHLDYLVRGEATVLGRTNPSKASPSGRAMTSRINLERIPVMALAVTTATRAADVKRRFKALTMSIASTISAKAFRATPGPLGQSSRLVGATQVFAGHPTSAAFVLTSVAPKRRLSSQPRGQRELNLPFQRQVLHRQYAPVVKDGLILDYPIVRDGLVP